MAMWSDIAAWLNGIEKSLAYIPVALVNVTVLAKTRADLCLLAQIVEVFGVENFHDLFHGSQAMSAETIC